MGLSILIVDDTKFLRLMLGDILRKAGHEVIAEAENGEIGVQQFRKFMPDLVVLDLTMPVMDGITTLREIRKIQPDAMIIICSAMSQRDLISEAIDAGANGYIMKPFEPDRVKQAINQIMDRIIRTVPEVMEETIEIEVEVEAEVKIEIEDEVEVRSAIQVSDMNVIENGMEEQLTELQFALNPFQELHNDNVQLQQSLYDDNEAITLHHDFESDDEIEIGDLVHREEVEVIDDKLLFGALIEAEAVGVEVEVIAEEVVRVEEVEEVVVVEEDEDEEEEVVVEEVEVKEDVKVVERNQLQPEIGVVQFRKNINRFNSSIMCNWEENVDNNDTNYFVIHSEVSETLRIEMMNENQQKQSITFSVEGFSYLVDWLEDKGVITRNHIA